MHWKTNTIRKGICLAAIAFFLLIFHGSAQNPIVTENAQAGNPASEWDIAGTGDQTIQGFATDISVNKGSTVHFKIKTNATSYTINIYRIGYYGGNGARWMGSGTITASLPQNQPTPVTNSGTGIVDCGNWAESAHWDVPSNAVSGVYLAKLTRTNNGGSSHIIFVVRDDLSTSDLYFKTSDATWQAYNVYGGNSLYVGATSYPNGRAVKVSYNRPFFTRVGGGGGTTGGDYFFNAEYPMIRFLERNGYNVSYATDIDADRYGSLIKNHKAFLSVGHDEYWSAAERTNVETALNTGVHLAFFSGNEVYWKTRWENSEDGSNTSYRTLVCYKEGTLGENTCGNKCDPSSAWTGLWRDGAAYDAGRPENGLSGEISWSSSEETSIQVPGEYKDLRFWRNTSIAAGSPAATTTLPAGTLGYEWDYEQYEDSYPAGRITMSKTTIGGLTHKLSLYKHASGAWVFGAGSMQWAWGLDAQHDRGNAPASRDMQQATVNLFADMDVQPATLQADLVPATASTDTQPPVTTITYPANGASIPSTPAILITGTSSDNSAVGGIEISFDGGVTWKKANGAASWSYTWIPAAAGLHSIRVRGVDDSGNMETPGNIPSNNAITVAISNPPCPCTLFTPGDAPQAVNKFDNVVGIELGMKFRTSVTGFIKGVRFYKGTSDVGQHTASLWTMTGSKLAEGIFTNESASGWQEMAFSSPVPVSANTTYIVSYHSPTGYYASTPVFFTSNVIYGPLTGIGTDAADGPNGVYRYSPTPVFPNDHYQSANYWVDPVFVYTTETQSPLPVSLINLTATPGNRKVTLNWSTASESNNHGFDVQRSLDGTSWITIGFVPGAGNSEATRNYSYNDPGLDPGKYYYRLIQVDIDGRSRYSPVVIAGLLNKPVFELGQSYPNPAHTQATLQFILPQAGSVNISLFDVSGRMLKVLINGSKEAGTHSISFNVSSLAKGVYYYKMHAGDFTDVKKLTIQ